MNRAVASVDMQNRRTTLRYDSLFLRAVVDPAGQVDSLVRNALGWVTKDIRPAVTPLPLRAVYDINGNVVRSINRQGQAVTFAYDALDRDTLRIAGTDTARFKHVVYASLNAGIAGYIVGQNAEATDTSFFDILGRLKRRTVGLGGSAYTFAYTFNPNGLRLSVWEAVSVLVVLDALRRQVSRLLVLSQMSAQGTGVTLRDI